MKDSLDKYEKEIMQKKKSKLLRDKLDFKRGNAYKWSHRGNKRSQNKPTTGAGTAAIMKPNTESQTSDVCIIRHKRPGYRSRKGKIKIKSCIQQERQSQAHGLDISPEQGQETHLDTNTLTTRIPMQHSAHKDDLEIINLSSYNLSDIEIGS